MRVPLAEELSCPPAPSPLPLHPPPPPVQARAQTKTTSGERVAGCTSRLPPPSPRSSPPVPPLPHRRRAPFLPRHKLETKTKTTSSGTGERRWDARPVLPLPHRRRALLLLRRRLETKTKMTSGVVRVPLSAALAEVLSTRPTPSPSPSCPPPPLAQAEAQRRRRRAASEQQYHRVAGCVSCSPRPSPRSSPALLSLPHRRRALVLLRRCLETKMTRR